MSRSGAGVYSKPAGTTPANGNTIDAPQFNLLMDDIAADLNIPRPIVAGGTGASTAAAARTALAVLGTASNLSDLTSVATARTNLGVETQTAPADATAGRVLTVGAFGTGQVGAVPLLASIDTTTTPSGEYSFDAATTGTFPTGVLAATGGMVDLNRLSATAGFETLVAADQNAMFFRRLSTTFAPWQSLISVLTSTVADGDTIARQSGAWARVAKGAAGQVYRQNDALTAPAWTDALQVQTPQATTSGTAFDFTAIPAWAKRITVICNNISLSGANNLLVQIGTAAGIVATGYASTGSAIEGAFANQIASTAGFVVFGSAAAFAQTFTMVLNRLGPASFLWVASHSGFRTGSTIHGGGSITLAAALDRVRLTRTGTDTFDSGSVTISYE